MLTRSRLFHSLPLHRGAPCGDSVPSETLARAYEHCRQVCRHYGTTYYFATRFFPADVRPAVWALYAWVRYPDEWVDNPGTLTVAERCERLAGWRAQTERAIRTGNAEHPALLAWGDAARKHGVPLRPMYEFLDAMEMDVTVGRYETFSHLEAYTWGSASVVGLMMCDVVGKVAPEGKPYATSLGTAMQLTNFLRDIGEDWRDRQRIYLPLEDLRRFGVTEKQIADGIVDDNFRALMRFEIQRTRALYAHADEGMCFLPDAARRPVRLARVLYSRILGRIERNDFDVFTKRARVPTAEKLAVLAADLARPGG